jgi:hypothetical protein
MKRILLLMTVCLLIGAAFATRSFNACEKDNLLKANVEALTQNEIPGELSPYKYIRIDTYCQHINSGSIFPCLGAIVYCFQPGYLDNCIPHGCTRYHY